MSDHLACHTILANNGCSDFTRQLDLNEVFGDPASVPHMFGAPQVVRPHFDDFNFWFGNVPRFFMRL